MGAMLKKTLKVMKTSAKFKFTFLIVFSHSKSWEVRNKKQERQTPRTSRKETRATKKVFSKVDLRVSYLVSGTRLKKFKRSSLLHFNWELFICSNFGIKKEFRKFFIHPVNKSRINTLKNWNQLITLITYLKKILTQHC